jgi:hypothetical protein
MYKKIVELKKPILVYIKFALILSIAYFPLWSFMMSIKNDALTLSYPPFYFFCQQLASGHMPWWHFNIHLGLPLHADPGFPFWSPITWLWALFGGGLHSYTLLIYFYVLIAGIGMIKLTKWFGFSEPVQLMLGITFSVSGFFSAHLQHPHYIFEAAFVPFVLLFFLQLLFQPNIRHSIYLAISIFFLVNSGYPSFTISALYFFTILLICFLIFKRTELQVMNIFKALLISLIIAILLCLPAIYSVYQFYPFFNRSISPGENYLGSGGMTIRSLLSFLFPLASVSDPAFFGTDRAWSNIYIGILPLIFLIYALRYTTNQFKYPLIISGAFMLMASMQGNFKSLLNSILPFFNKMHSNGGLRIYFIVSALIISGMGAEHYLKYVKEKQFKKIVSVLIILFVISISIALIFMHNTSTWNIDNIKNLPVTTAILIQSILGLIIAAILKTYSKKIILITGICEIIIAFIINIPFTGLGTKSTAYVQNHIDSLVKHNAHQKDNTIHYDSATKRDAFINDPVLFNNKIAISRPSTYPSGFSNYAAFIKKEGLEKLNLQQPVLSLKDFEDNHQQLELERITAYGDEISFTANSKHDNDTLVILQNFYPNWKYYIKDSKVQQYPALETFTGIKTNSGSFTIKGVYWPKEVVICFMISIFAWAGIFVVLIKKRKAVDVYGNN